MIDPDAQPWDILAAAGIQVRETAGRAYAWEYAIPAIHRDWSGPYPTKAEALIAAVHHLIQRAQEHQSDASTGRPAPPDQHQAVGGAEQEMLLRRLEVLRLQAAAYGNNTPPYIKHEIDSIEQRLAVIDSQTAQLVQGDQSPAQAERRSSTRKTSHQTPTGLPTDPERRRAMLLAEQEALQERLHSLRLRATRLGIAIDPQTVLEMEDAQKHLAAIDRQLQDLANTSPH